MGEPKYSRFVVAFDEWFPQGLYLVGEIAPVREYQSQEDKARNRPVRPRIDEVSGRPLFRGTFAETSGQAKWIAWTIQATGMTALGHDGTGS
jgi:hypothetical protein